MAHVSDSNAAAATVAGGDGFNSEEQPVLDDVPAPQSANDKIAQQEDELEVKKKRLLEEIESVLDKTQRNSPPNPNPNPVRPSLGLGIEVIDETALLDTVPNKTTTSKNGKQSKNGRRGGSKKSVTEEAKRNGKTKIKYTRKEMEALRYVNVGQQRKFWKALYATLQSVVAKEYDTLAATTTTPHPPLPKKKPILGAVYCENMDRDSENVNPVDPSCSPSLMGEDGCSILEKCSEDDDSEDDYSSIQRPAFLVEGEPNFDSGPPEDGWEYLRRVRWEADRIPKVKMAKLDRCKLNKEQSAYMPKIPDIAKCPEHLLPLKQWEDVFLAEFSALRANLSCLLESTSAMHSGDPQPVHSSQPVGNNFGESASVMNGDVLLCNHLSIGKATDQPSNLTAEDQDSILPLETGSKASIDQTSSSCPTPPLLSAILRMDSVARVSMLLKRISSLEPANTITRNDCMWLFALCATVDAPLHADASAALRSLLRKCASIRAGKAELDEEVVMLNILATISGRYFGQSED